MKKVFSTLFIYGGYLIAGLCIGFMMLVDSTLKNIGMDEAFVPMIKAALIMDKYYIEPADHQKLKQSMIAGIVDGRDPHTHYLPPEEEKKWQDDMQGVYGGIGIGAKLDASSKSLEIKDVAEKSPALINGLKVGDKIVSIDGKPVDSANLGENYKRIRGAVDTNVELEIQRDGAIQKIKIQRKTIEIPNIQWRVLRENGKNVAWIKISKFNEEIAPQLKSVVDAIGGETEDAIDAMMLDLRDNPGGLITSAVALVSFFNEDEKTVVTSKGRTDSANMTWKSRYSDWATQQNQMDYAKEARQKHPWLLSAKMSVIVNRRSASASEISAAALKDWGRASIVGNNTFGKGSVQTLFPLGDGNGSMKVTTSRYFTPKGAAIQAVGVPVDVKVSSALDIGAKEADLPMHLTTAPSQDQKTSTPSGKTAEAELERLRAATKDGFGSKEARQEIEIEAERSTFSSKLPDPKGRDKYVAAAMAHLFPGN